jgi:branched-subunit amino acid aminotransferase/4-amino-4-deoxychorismate lyase
MKKQIVFLDGDFLELKEAKFSLIEPAFLYGWSVFETTRAYKKNIVYLKQHLQRVKESAPYLYLNFNYSFEKIKQVIFKLIDLNKIEDAYVRLTLFRNYKEKTSIFVWVKPYRAYPESKYLKGFCACISDFKVNAGSFFTQIKSGNYLLYQLSYLKAKESGFDEAIILNNKGYIAEASRSNIFFVKKDTLFTPSPNCGCLKGITRQVILDIAKKNNIKVKEGNFLPQDLYRAEEAFLTNSLAGVMPLVYIEKYRIGKSPFRLTGFFIKEYNSLLKNGR